MLGVKYVGPSQDYSGYGEAVRHDILALVDRGTPVTTKTPRYTSEIADFGVLGERLSPLEGLDIPYRSIILHTTPNVYSKYFEPGKYHIARVFWETDRLPLEFARNIELCDEVWTGSRFNEEAIRRAGVTKPIYIIPEAIDTSLAIEKIKPYVVRSQDTFSFYSIFEWTERKNPAALLTAFWLEFENDPDVSLTIKTYVDNFTKINNEEIDNFIYRIKGQLGLANYAKTYLYRNLMDRGQIYRFHKSFDCFVSAHRGEGWGIPQMEAMLLGNPVISTNCGGIHEYIKDHKEGYMIPYTISPLQGNSRNRQWYTPDQGWATVHMPSLRTALREVYTKRDEAKEIGLMGRNLVLEKFSTDAVGSLMRERLEAIGD